MKFIEVSAKIILTIILKIIYLPIYIIEFFIPSKNVRVFGGRIGMQYNDNSKTLFEYAIKQNSNTQFVWITKNQKIYDQLNKEGKICYMSHSLKGMYYCIVAKVLIFSVSWIDLPTIAFLFNKKKTIVQLWHGTPLKDFTLKGGPIWKRVLRFMLVTHLGRTYDYVISATHLVDDFYQNLFGISKDKIIVLGQPRNDELFLPRKENIFDGNYQRKYLYMPTYRNHKFDIFEGIAQSGMEEFLSKTNSILAIKPHPTQTKSVDLGLKNTFFIAPDVDMYEYLSEFDVLLTEYSSVYFDYLLLDRPIIFNCFDLNIYLQSQGLIFNYNEVTPGHKTQNWKQTVQAMEELLTQDKYAQQRKEINKKFNEYPDGNSSQRIFEFISNLK